MALLIRLLFPTTFGKVSEFFGASWTIDWLLNTYRMLKVLYCRRVFVLFSDDFHNFILTFHISTFLLHYIIINLRYIAVITTSRYHYTFINILFELLRFGINVTIETVQRNAYFWNTRDYHTLKKTTRLETVIG